MSFVALQKNLFVSIKCGVICSLVLGKFVAREYSNEMRLDWANDDDIPVEEGSLLLIELCTVNSIY